MRQYFPVVATGERRGVLLALTVMGVFAVTAWPAAGRAPQQGASASRAVIPEPVSQTAVAATVGQTPIYVGEVERQLQRVLSRRQVAQKLLPSAKAEILRELVNRRLVEHYLLRAGKVVTKQDVDKAEEAFVKFLGGQEQLKEYLQSQGITKEDLRLRETYRIAWPLYLGRHLTDQRLQQRFESDQPRYDGTQIRVSHLLLKVPDPQGDEEQRNTLAQAEQIHSQILAGELSFDQAVRRYSAAPSKNQGGDLGLIRRTGQMVEAFSAAAFALNDGELSRPVLTPFGVHLIRRTETVAGTGSWQDARLQLSRDLMRELFLQAAKEERQHTKVIFTGRSPYFDQEGQLQGLPPESTTQSGESGAKGSQELGSDLGSLARQKNSQMAALPSRF